MKRAKEPFHSLHVPRELHIASAGNTFSLQLNKSGVDNDKRRGHSYNLLASPSLKACKAYLSRCKR